jgi:hypothetical protein
MITIYGPDLRGEDRGTFHVHATGCPESAYLVDCETEVQQFSSQEETAMWVYGPCIDEGTTMEEAIGDIHFAPCALAVFETAQTGAKK